MALGRKNSPLRVLQRQHEENPTPAKCERCGQMRLLTVDHIFPVSYLHAWGFVDDISDDNENFQLLCRACNELKGANFDFTNPKTVPLIRKYIEKLIAYYNE